MRVDVREQRQIDHAELADWAKEARLSLLVSGHTNCRVNYAASDRGANTGAYTLSSGSHDLKVVTGGVATYNSTDPGAASVNFSALDALGNGDFTVWFISGPLASSGTTYKQVFGQSGSAGSCWLTANADENYAVVNGQIVMGLLQTGVNRSSIKAASALDGASHAWCVRKRGTTGQWWRDGIPLTTTTSGTLTGAPTAAGDTVYLVGSSLDGSAAMPEGLVMLAAARAALGDDLCAKLATRRGAWQVWRPRRIRVPVSGGPATYNVDLTETATATDALTVIASYALAVSESATATDAASAVATWPRSVSESATASDIVSAVQTLGAAVSETVSATDLVSAILAAAAAISDAATATDAVTSSLNGNIYPVSLTESATSTDTVAAVAQMVAQIAESASSGDAYAVAANLVALLTETGSPADVVAVPGGYSVSLTEAAAALDVVAAAVAGVITPSAAPFGHGPDASRRLGALLGRRAGTFSRTR